MSGEPRLGSDAWRRERARRGIRALEEGDADVVQDAQGGELRLLVTLVEDFGVETIIEALEIMTPERQAELVVSTAHKAKGREWDAVRLGGDFPDAPVDEELRLLYVAVTRARRRLDVSGAGYFNDEQAQSAPEPARRLPLDRIPTLDERIVYSRGGDAKPFGDLTAAELRSALELVTGGGSTL